ncbi:MAG: peptide chain release factor 2, partial [Candidatus Cloacimonetes bacterium]|nr:peptide chain release factor 2 [Candidatus Cloacimonadota bacterium]
MKTKLNELEGRTNDSEFWNDLSEAKKINKEISSLKRKIDRDEQLKEIIDDIETYVFMLQEEFSNDLLEDSSAAIGKHKELIDSIEIEFLLNGQTDNNPAILTIHPGAGGTESQDWAEMLLRMYQRWAEMRKFEFKIIDLLPGDEAGVKSVTVEIIGEYAYGLLKCENGVHRLVRISPFNAQGKRQTSFVSIFAYPLIEEDLEIEINTKDIRIDTYRASGAGGQHVNKTDSAVRITHEPTGIIVQCQNERSQISNRETAMKMLKSRLYQLELQEREKEKSKLESTKSEIGWGSQIRSYVFRTYQMVKDHRPNFDVCNT